VHEIIILRWGHQTRFARSDPTRLEEKEQKKGSLSGALFFFDDLGCGARGRIWPERL